MNLLNSTCNVIGALTGTIIMTPHPTAVGNCAEHIYFGLLKARRERKKLAILFPYELPWKLRFRRTNVELTTVESEYRAMPYGSVGYIIASILLTAYFVLTRSFNLLLSKLFKRRLPDRHILPLIGTTTLWQPSEDIAEFSWEIVKSYDWTKTLQAPINVRFRSYNLDYAEKTLRNTGLPENAWFVCLHVRDGGFHNDALTSSERNAEILNYIPAIHEITSRGGWVVRMGDTSMKRLPEMEHVIDYPFTKEKNEIMDIYLISKCRAYIGMQSGIYDIAVLFQRPIILTNMTNWLYPFPPKRSDIGVFKHPYSISRQRFLSLKEWFSEGFESLSFLSVSKDYIFHENTPDELRDVVAEFFGREDNFDMTDIQLTINRVRIEAGKKLLSNQIVCSSNYDDIHQRYRLASRLDSATGSICSKFLNQNWEFSSNNCNSNL